MHLKLFFFWCIIKPQKEIQKVIRNKSRICVYEFVFFSNSESEGGGSIGYNRDRAVSQYKLVVIYETEKKNRFYDRRMRVTEIFEETENKYHSKKWAKIVFDATVTFVQKEHIRYGHVARKIISFLKKGFEEIPLEIVV